MGYEDFIKIQQKLDNTEKLWHKVEESKEKFKISVKYNSKVIFYEDLYNQLSTQDKENFLSAEDLRDNLNMYFKYENTSFHFVKSYKEFVMKKFENGYLWDKITSNRKYEKLYKEVEYIDDYTTHIGVGIKYTDMYNAIKHDYSKYFTTKREMKKVLKRYFDNNNIINVFTDDKEVFENFTTTVIKQFKNI